MPPNRKRRRTSLSRHAQGCAVAAGWVRQVGLFSVFVDVLLDVMSRFAAEWHTHFLVYASSRRVVFSGDGHGGHAADGQALVCGLPIPHAVAGGTEAFDVMVRGPLAGGAWRRRFGLWRAFPTGTVRVRLKAAGMSVCALDLLGGHVQPRGHGPARFLSIGRQRTAAVSHADGAARTGASGEPFAEHVALSMDDRQYLRIRGVVKGRLPPGVFVRRSVVSHEFDVRATLHRQLKEGDALAIHFTFGRVPEHCARGVFSAD